MCPSPAIQGGLTGAKTPTVQELLALSPLSPNSSLTPVLSLPTRNSFPCLAPITKNIASQRSFLPRLKTSRFSRLFQPTEVFCSSPENIVAARSPSPENPHRLALSCQRSFYVGVVTEDILLLRASPRKHRTPSPLTRQRSFHIGVVGTRKGGIF